MLAFFPQKDGLDDEPIDVISIEEQDKEEATGWQMETTVDIATLADGGKKQRDEAQESNPLDSISQILKTD